MKEWLLEELENEVVSLFDFAEKNYRIENQEEKLQMQNVLLTYRQYFDQIFFLLQKLRPKIQKIFKEECTSMLERIHLITGAVDRVSDKFIYEVLDGILQDIAIMCVVVPDYFLEMKKQEEMEEIKEDVFKYVEEKESSVITKAEYTLLNKITELICLKRKWQINKKAEIVYILDEMEVW